MFDQDPSQNVGWNSLANEWDKQVVQGPAYIQASTYYNQN